MNGEIWADLLDIDPNSVRSDSTINIRLTAAILSEISARLENPTPAAVATLYNNMAADYLTGYGLTIEQYMELQPWESGLYGLSGEILDGLSNPENYLNQLTNHCFLEDSSVQMWPLDPSIKPRADGSYDEELVLSKVWYKRQDQMQAGDLVVSPDKWGRLQPGRVTRTMTNTATHILDFWGTGVTPGHAYNCADGPLKGGFAPIMDILRMDGALMRSDGTMFRSTTNCDVGSTGDRIIHAEATIQKPDGTWTPKKRGQIRFGTRISTPDGTKSVSVMEIAERQGWSLSDDGYMVGKIEGADGTVQEGQFPFPYTHGAELPKPEAYILTRSQVTLEDIYLANEWEQISTRMPAPNSLAGFNPNSTMKRTKPKPNIPPAFANRPDAPTVKNRAQRPAHASASPSAPGMNRKQRKAMEAKQRKATKLRKRAAG
ncbi:hypothetical protein [Tateyamaria sp.]|uniref:hypothetical protein n=1 Tax=Tateyamaria sp. TaxID=1929288 RepID=UPI00329EFAE8